jgi:hypothetical protein
LITWIQFGCLQKGEVAETSYHAFCRNTIFNIYSLTGRAIGEYSQWAGRDIVLFLPHSTLFVLKHMAYNHGKQHIIYMRQVELGLSEWSVLWIDNNRIENSTAMRTKFKRTFHSKIINQKCSVISSIAFWTTFEKQEYISYCHRHES